MNPFLVRYLIALLLLVGGGGGAFAHTRSESHTSWTIDGRLVRVDVTVPDLEAKRIDPGGQRPTDAAMIAYLRPRIGVVAANRECPIAAPPLMMLAAPRFRRTEFIFDCPGTADLSLHFNAFFELVSNHIDLAQIQFQNGDFVEQLFTADTHTLDLKASQGGELADASFLRFVEMGIMHIFTGVDHMSFLLGLVLI